MHWSVAMKYIHNSLAWLISTACMHIVQYVCIFFSSQTSAYVMKGG